MDSMRKMGMIGVGILAGGKSRRMGTDKGLVKLDGVALIERIARQVTNIASEIFVITNRIDEYKQFGYPVVADQEPSRHSVSAVVTVTVLSISIVHVVVSVIAVITPHPQLVVVLSVIGPDEF